MQPLGTILPTRESLQRADRFADQQDRQRRKIEEKTLAGLECRVVGGERRYYDGDKYAIIGRDMRPRWFKVTPDGDFPIR